MLERLKDSTTRAALKKEIKGGVPGWYDHYTAVGGDWSRMLISAKNNYQGLTMDKIWPPHEEQGWRLLDAFFDLLIEEGGSVSTVYDHHTEKDMNLAMTQPWCSIGSDAWLMRRKGRCGVGIPIRAASARFRASWAFMFGSAACCVWKTPFAR